MSRPNDDQRRSSTTDGSDRGARDVAVPLRVYKTVTVFSTLIAVGCVVGGFMLLDWATNRTTAPVEEVDPLAAVGGLALIAAGAVLYAFATRFRAEGMGKHKDDRDEGSNDG